MAANGLLLLRPDSQQAMCITTAASSGDGDTSSEESDEQRTRTKTRLGLGLYLQHVWEVKPHVFASVRDSFLSENASRNATYWSRALSSEVSLRTKQAHFSDEDGRYSTVCSLLFFLNTNISLLSKLTLV